MKPALLQTDWLNRVAFDPESSAPLMETFFITAAHPKHRRALWIRLNLFNDGKEKYGEVQALYFDAEEGFHRVAKERWPVNRIQIDPERAGVGIGESNVQEAASTGLVRGTDFALSWDMTMVDDGPAPHIALPARWLYRSASTGPKLCSPHASVTLRGKLELWHGLSRHVDVTRIDLTGWRAMQGHHWGPQLGERFAWTHANCFDESPAGSYFEAYAGGLRVNPLFSPEVLIGKLVVGGETYRFDTWRNLLSTPTRFTPTDWSFELSGPEGRVQAKLTAEPRNTVGLPLTQPGGKRSHSFCSKLASLVLDLTPLRGRKRTLHSHCAAYEIAQPEPRGAVESPAAA